MIALRKYVTVIPNGSTKLELPLFHLILASHALLTRISRDHEIAALIPRERGLQLIICAYPAAYPSLPERRAIHSKKTRPRLICSHENLLHLLNGLHQRVDLFFSIIEREGRPRRCRHLEALHQRLGAVMTGTHGDTFLI